MSDEKFYTINNISAKQLDILYKALDTYVSSGILQFEECINNDFIYGSFSNNTNLGEIHDACENLRHTIAKTNSKFRAYPRDARWNLGIYSEEAPKDAKEAFDMALQLRKDVGIQRLPSKSIEDSNTIEVIKFNPRKEKITKLLNKNKE